MISKLATLLGFLGLLNAVMQALYKFRKRVEANRAVFYEETFVVAAFMWSRVTQNLEMEVLGSFSTLENAKSAVDKIIKHPFEWEEYILESSLETEIPGVPRIYIYHHLIDTNGHLDRIMVSVEDYLKYDEKVRKDPFSFLDH